MGITQPLTTTRKKMTSQLGHSLYNVSKFVTFFVHPSQIPFVFHPPTFTHFFLCFFLSFLHFLLFSISHTFLHPVHLSLFPSLRLYVPLHLIPFFYISFHPLPPSLLSPSSSNRTRPVPLTAFPYEKKRQPMHLT